MAEKKLSTIKKLLTPHAQIVAEQIINKFGGTNILLSAGVIALSKMKSDEREKMVEEANKSVEETPPQTENVEQAINTVVRLMSESGVEKITVLPNEYDQLKKIFVEMFGPKRYHKKA